MKTLLILCALVFPLSTRAATFIKFNRWTTNLDSTFQNGDTLTNIPGSGLQSPLNISTGNVGTIVVTNPLVNIAFNGTTLFGTNITTGMSSFGPAAGLGVGLTNAQGAGNIRATNNITADGQFNGNGLGISNVVSFNYSTSTNLVINTASETSLYSVAVPANALASTKDLWTHVGGYFTNNSGAGAGVSLEIKIKYGATVLYDSTLGTGSLGGNANARPLWIDLHLQNAGSSGQQFLTGCFFIGNPSAPTTGIGSIASGAAAAVNFSGYSAVDSTAAQTFDVRVVLGTATNACGVASVASFAKLQ